MKLRIAISALLVASMLGFGLSYAVSAASSCPSIDVETDKEVHQCSASYVVDAVVPLGGSLMVRPVPAFWHLPNAPEVGFLGNAQTISVTDVNGLYQPAVHLEVCIADDTTSGNVYWWSAGSSTKPGSWVLLATYHLPGWDCAASSLPGTYTAN
jgi:hypothetical protein